jgi:hypothetical protein
MMMKKVFMSLALIVTATLISCAQSAEGENEKNPVEITFEETTHDYGTIEYNGDGTYAFEFKNTGTEPLILTNVRSSCGCTVPKWPREPIEIGETGKITVKYNTKIAGKFSKSVTVYSNASNSPVVLRITGVVEKNQSN